MNLPTITPGGPDPEAEDTRAFWREAGRALVRESLATLDETAKQLIAVSGILIGLYFHAIAFSDLRGRIRGWTELVYVAPIALLLVSLLCSLLVFLPDRSRLNLNSWEASKRTYERTLRVKLRTVRLASLFLVLGLLAVAVAAVSYLGG